MAYFSQPAGEDVTMLVRELECKRAMLPDDLHLARFFYADKASCVVL